MARNKVLYIRTDEATWDWLGKMADASGLSRARIADSLLGLCRNTLAITQVTIATRPEVTYGTTQNAHDGCRPEAGAE